MPTEQQLAEVAQALARAYDTKQAIAAPIESHPDLSIDDAYEIQLQQINARVAGGAVVKGYKVGLTSKAMQTQLGVDQPDFGHLLADMFLLENTPIAASHYLQPKVEPEIAFVLGSPLAGPGVNVAEAMRAVDFVLPALELIDSRIENWHISIADTIADNASSAGVILGSQPTSLRGLDLGLVTCDLFMGSATGMPAQPIASGVGAAVLGSPINALVWLANTLGARGIAFQPGDVIMPGSVTASYPVNSSTVVAAAFSGLGTVKAIFE